MDTGFETAHGTSETGAFAERLPPWVALLGSTIASEVLPRLLVAHRDGGTAGRRRRRGRMWRRSWR